MLKDLEVHPAATLKRATLEYLRIDRMKTPSVYDREENGYLDLAVTTRRSRAGRISRLLVQCVRGRRPSWTIAAPI
jgi:hypothetical protein